MRNNKYSLLFIFVFVHSTWGNFVNLNDVAKSFHLQLKQEKDKIHLSNSQNHWVFQENSKEVFLNNTKLFLTYPVQSKLVGKKNPKKYTHIPVIQ